MNRRRFLLGCSALTVAAAAPAVLARDTGHARMPVLWGDGVHDDAPALQAMVDGLPFVRHDMRRAYRLGANLRVPSGATLVFDRPAHLPGRSLGA